MKLYIITFGATTPITEYIVAPDVVQALEILGSNRGGKLPNALKIEVKKVKLSKG